MLRYADPDCMTPVLLLQDTPILQIEFIEPDTIVAMITYLLKIFVDD
jgi:hypothetical protein